MCYVPNVIQVDQIPGNHREVVLGCKNKASGGNGSHHQPDMSSNDSSLSESEPASLPKSEEIAGVDESTDKITINRERIFGTNNIDSTLALTRQVVSLLPTAAPGKLNSQNVKWALATICGIDPKDELEG